MSSGDGHTRREPAEPSGTRRVSSPPPGPRAPDADEGFFAWTREAHILLTADGVVSAWNPAAAAILQISAADAVGQLWAQLVPGLADLIPPVTATGEAPAWQRRSLARASGDVLEVEATAGWRQGHIIMLLAACPDAGAGARTVERRLQEILDAVPAMVAVVSLRDGLFTPLYQSARGFASTGWANDEWERDPDFTAKLLHPEDRDHLLELQSKVRAEKASYEVEYRLRRPDGSYMWLLDMATTVHDAAGVPDFWVGFVVDISQQKATEDTLRETLRDLSAAHAEVEAISQAKSDYLSVVSHEFRTPLTSIQGYSEIMAGGGLDAADVREFSGIIEANAQRLGRMITDLLNLDRLESGQRRRRPVPVQLDALVQEVIASLAGISSGLEITLEKAANVPPIQADPDLLTQLVTNLVGNAIKYTPAPGHIAITITCPEPDWLELRVADSGPGIPPGALESIFDRFARLSRDELGPIAGTGLGLPIARQIAELHEGKIWAENGQVGAQFVVRLPCGGDGAPAG